MSAPLLRVEGLTKSFGALAVTDDVTFSVNEARLVALIGPNGAGKTTLINQLSGALSPTRERSASGASTYPCSTCQRALGRGLVRSFQIAAVLPEYSVLENVALAVQARARFELPLLPMRRAGGKAERARTRRAHTGRPCRSRRRPGRRTLAW